MIQQNGSRNYRKKKLFIIIIFLQLIKLLQQAFQRLTAFVGIYYYNLQL